MPLIPFETRNKQTGEPISAVLDVDGESVVVKIKGKEVVHGEFTDILDCDIEWDDDQLSLVSVEGAEEVVRAHMAKLRLLNKDNVPECLWIYIQSDGECITGAALEVNHETDEDGNDDNTTYWAPGDEQLRLSDTYTIVELKEIIAFIERINASLVPAKD